MKAFRLYERRENQIISLGIIVFWTFFWLLNVIDKFIVRDTLLWVGKDRLAQFVKYFSSIGIENPMVAFGVLSVTTILEFTAFVFGAFALYYFFKGDKIQTRGALFFSILTTIIVFSFFTIGDQIFGDRAELLEHSIYWVIAVLSWFIYTRFQH